MNINDIKSAIDNGLKLRELYGNDAAETERQQRRYRQEVTTFETAFGQRDAYLFSSPGRTEISGNHTDHNHGRVLAGAVNMDNIAVAGGNGTNTVRILSSGYPQFEVDLNNLQPSEAEYFTSASLVRGIAARLKELGYNIGGFDVVIDSGVPKGSGLSSSASFEVLIGRIFAKLFNNNNLDPVLNAQIGQYAENVFFGKPCGLMDQAACSVGGLITIDFADPAKPIVKKLNFDFAKTGYTLIITDTGGNHADLSHEYAAIPIEMKSVAKQMGKEVLREVSMNELLEAIPSLRSKAANDRAILRAIHFERENERVAQQVADLENGNFALFLSKTRESGYSSYMYNQNIYPASNVKEQGMSLALALSDCILGSEGAWRVHGGGFAGTIQAFVPNHLLHKYISTIEHTFGQGKCWQLTIREQGAVCVDVEN